MQKSLASLFLFFSSFIVASHAQAPVLIQDINNSIVSSNPRGMTNVNGTVFFAATDATHGAELWKTTGIESTTVLVKDINPNGNSNPANFCNVNGTVFFTANETAEGAELWKTDGTANGTQFITFMLLGFQNSASAQLTACNGKLFFRAYQGVVPPSGPPFLEQKLFVSDGTAAGTKVLASTLSQPKNLTAMGNTLFLSGISPGSPKGNQLLKTDGITVSVVRDFEFANETENDVPGNFINVNGTLFLSAKASNAAGRQIWRSNGTLAGTSQMTNTPFGFKVTEMEHVNGTLFFSGKQADPNQLSDGDHLFRLNGLNSVTEFVASGVAELTAFNGVLAFKQGGQVSSSLSRVGIAGAIVTTIATFPGSGFPSQLTVAGTNLFFEAGTDVMGRELWRSNSAGTVLVQDLVAGAINANISNLCARNSEVLFASDGLGGNELRKSNGAINGVITILNIGRASSSPKELVLMGGLTFFTADDGLTGRELWKTNGTAAGTVRVADIIPGSEGSDPRQLIVVTTSAGVQTLFFEAKSVSNGRELFKLENTLNGTPIRISDIAAGAGNAGIGNMTNVNGTLHFTATQNVFGLGDRIYKVNANRTAVQATGGSMTFVNNLAAMGSTLFFTQSPQIGPRLLNKLVADVTTQVASFQLAVGLPDPIPQQLTVVGSRLFFSAANGQQSRRLWVTNSGATSASPISTQNPSGLTNFNGRLVFVAPGNFPGINSIFRVNTLFNGVDALVNGSAINTLRATGTTLYFFQTLQGGAVELFKITTANNVAVALGSFPEGNSGRFVQAVTAGNNLFFTMASAASGEELWKSNGTQLGTAMVSDIRAGVGHSNIQAMAFLGTDLFLAADNLTSGLEPWRIINANAAQGDEGDERDAEDEEFVSETVAVEVVEIKVYPNPATDYVSVDISANETGGTLNLLSAGGQLVRTVSVMEGETTARLELQDLPKGIYLVRWEQEGAAVVTKKVLVQ